MGLSCSLRLSTGPVRRTRSAWFSAPRVVTRRRSGCMPERASRRSVIQSHLDLARPCFVNLCASGCEAVLSNKAIAGDAVGIRLACFARGVQIDAQQKHETLELLYLEDRGEPEKTIR